MNDGGEIGKSGPGRAPGPRCSLCGKPTSERYRPFCSKRCADVDLARWLGGNYVVPGGNTDADEDGDEGGAGTPPQLKERPDADE